MAVVPILHRPCLDGAHYQGPGAWPLRDHQAQGLALLPPFDQHVKVLRTSHQQGQLACRMHDVHQLRGTTLGVVHRLDEVTRKQAKARLRRLVVDAEGSRVHSKDVGHCALLDVELKPCGLICCLLDLYLERWRWARRVLLPAVPYLDLQEGAGVLAPCERQLSVEAHLREFRGIHKCTAQNFARATFVRHGETQWRAVCVRCYGDLGPPNWNGHQCVASC
mmetsp:Transcript_94194/g.281112  ORF Transcript_94194/g.281112 Transcript_94194/m.281112 type:complete len:221 (+) Transcript_94194:335-997(+)